MANTILSSAPEPRRVSTSSLTCTRETPQVNLPLAGASHESLLTQEALEDETEGLSQVPVRGLEHRLGPFGVWALMGCKGAAEMLDGSAGNEGTREALRGAFWGCAERPRGMERRKKEHLLPPTH